MFLLTVLTDETNMMRHKKPLLVLTMEQEAFRAKLPIAQASLMEWDRFLHNTRSPISQLIYGQIVYEMNCQLCGYVSKTWQHWPVFVINIPDDVRGFDSVPLTHLLRDTFNPYQVDYWCEYSCKKKGKIAMTKGRLSRCPDVMIMQINRTMYGANGQYGKVNTKVTFNLDHLDMTPYFIPLDGVDQGQLDGTCRPPFIYQCNAVIQHVGARLTVGHYWTLSRVPGQREWLNYNDTDVYPVDPKETQSKSSYILIYQRRK
jgi:ubiquitin C-terminal hydrolase